MYLFNTHIECDNVYFISADFLIKKLRGNVSCITYQKCCKTQSHILLNVSFVKYEKVYVSTLSLDNQSLVNLYRQHENNFRGTFGNGNDFPSLLQYLLIRSIKNNVCLYYKYIHMVFC